MTKRPEVGDTFIIRGTITYSDSTFFRYNQDHNRGQSCLMPLDHISEIIPKPWEPKVGDTVWAKNFLISFPNGAELLWVGGEFSLVKRSQSGYAPLIVHTSSLRKDLASCVA